VVHTQSHDSDVGSKYDNIYSYYIGHPESKATKTIKFLKNIY
jgi:hypothetical protein